MNFNLTIHNEEDIEYLKNIDKKRIEDLLRASITIGLKCISMGETKMDCHSYINPIRDIVEESTEYHKDKLFSIEDKLDNLLHIKTNSSRKGQLSEDICRSLLTKHYPSWSFIDVSNEGYCADCRAFDTPVGQILYEFKSYDHNINRGEITKFIRDLDHTNMKYGIFVSNTSGIVGKKNIEWEIIDNKLIVFVSNMGLNGYGCILGTELLVSLIEINILEKDNNWLLYQNYELEEVVQNISSSIDMLRSNIEGYTKHRELIGEQRVKINQSLDILDKSSFNCLLNLNHSFETIIDSIKNIETKKDCISETFDKEEFISKLSNDKFIKLFEKFIKICSSYSITNNKTELIILNNNHIVCFTKTLKTKIEIIFPIKQENITFSHKYEKIRGKEIFIELKEDFKIWEIITNRLKIN